MFYYLLFPSLTYNWILIASAVIPAIFLMIKVYRSDKMERESPAFLLRLAISGVIATLIAIALEKLGSLILGALVPEESTLYNILLYFVVVGLSEECSKYFLLKKRTWRSPEFNCQYDAVVYAAFVSLGFALWENISYVLHYGFATAVVRALTAIPGHLCFGIFMGIFYGLARSYAYMREKGKSRFFRVLAVIIPAAIHGTYDYIATTQTKNGSFVFIGFIVVLFVISFILVNRISKNDRYINASKEEIY